ncbi:MAG: hypothetical protein AABX28_02760 [Nanoarchaeota archaeon]
MINEEKHKNEIMELFEGDYGLALTETATNFRKKKLGNRLKR